MPYALFENEAKLSRAFPTASDVLRCAEDCGLVVDGPDGKPRLEGDYSIKPCAPDPEQELEPAWDGNLQKTDRCRNESRHSKLSPQVQQP